MRRGAAARAMATVLPAARIMSVARRGSLVMIAAFLAAPRPSLAAPPVPRPARQAEENAAEGIVEETVVLPIFGKVRIFRPEPLRRTRAVILFVSGEGGFGLGVAEMARHIAPEAIVAGLPLPAWKRVVEKTKGKCWFPAGELEETAQAIEKVYRMPRYLKPILIGFGQGATAVYAALAQAPAEAFAGAISLGFCPRMEVARPVCGRGDWKPQTTGKIRKVTQVAPRPDLVPRADGAARWTILQGAIDQVCDPEAAARFAGLIPAARIVPLPKVGHGFTVLRSWEGAFVQAVDALAEPQGAWEPSEEERAHLALARAPSEIRRRLEALDLPLEVDWPEAARQALVFVSGDGGWAELDQQVTAGLTARGVAVVGWNALRYFWAPKTPADFRADLEKVLRALPDDMPLFAGGYSFGAEVVPATIAQGPLARLSGLVLLAPGPYASYEISPLDWLRSSETETEHSVGKSLSSLGSLPVLCLEPSDHAATGCPDGIAAGVTRVVLPGGHHFAGDFAGLTDRIIAFLRSPTSGPAVTTPPPATATPPAAAAPAAAAMPAATPPPAAATPPN